MERFNKRLKKTILGVSPEAIKILESYEWPGNVRELQHAIEHAFVKAANGYLLPEHFPLLHQSNEATPITLNEPKAAAPLSLTKEDIIRELAASNGNASKVAKRFGVSRVTLWKYMKRFAIKRNNASK